MDNEKWTLFKNFLHNELGITKDDIREWLQEAVKEEAKKMVDQTYGKFSPEAVVKRVLLDYDLFRGDHFKKEVIEKVGELIAKQIQIIPAEPKKLAVLDIELQPCGCTRLHQDSKDQTLFVCPCGETRRRMMKFVNPGSTACNPIPE